MGGASVKWTYDKKLGTQVPRPEAKPRAAEQLGPVLRTFAGEGTVPCAWLVNPTKKLMRLVRLDTLAIVRDTASKKATKSAVAHARQVKLPGTELEHRYIDRPTLALLRLRRAQGRAAE